MNISRSTPTSYNIRNTEVASVRLLANPIHARSSFFVVISNACMNIIMKDFLLSNFEESYRFLQS